MFSLCFSLLSHLNSTLQIHSQQHFSSDSSLATRAQGCGEGQGLPCSVHRGETLNSCEPTSPSLAQWLLSSFTFGQCCAFFPTIMAILWLTSNSQCSCPSLLLPLLPLACLLAPYQGLWISALYCFLHTEVPSGFAAFAFPLLLLHVMLCCPLFSWHCSLSCAKWLLFFLWEMSLKTHCPYIKEWNKDELAWLGKPGKYASLSDESGLPWALIFQNRWTHSTAKRMAS